MSPPVHPQQDFTDLAQLASRITQHLARNPQDQQARDDLKYVTGKLQSSAGAANAQDTTAANGTPDPHPGYSIAAGLTQAAADIPKGVGHALLHPIDTFGQMTGLANVPNMLRVGSDPDASVGEKLDALVRATPLNMGYAPERALLDATGANLYGVKGTDDTPASLEDQAHAAGNVASLGLLGVKPGALVRPLTRLVGRGLLGKTLSSMVADKPPANAPEGFTKFGEPTAPTPTGPPKGPTATPAPEIDPSIAGRGDVQNALNDYRAGKIDRETLDATLEYAGRDQPFAQRRTGATTAASDALPRRSGTAPFQGNTPTAPPTAGLPLEPASVAGVPPGLRPGEQAATTTTLENPHENLPPGRGMEVTGNRATPVPPTEPTILEMQEGEPPQAWMDHAQKLGASPEAARQAWLTKTPLDQLPGLSDAQRQGLTDFANKEIAVTKETMGRVQRGAGPSKLAYRQRAFPSPMQSTGAVVRSPIYQHADVIAQRIANDPEIQAQFPAYQGLDQNAARSLLLQQLVANAQAGNPVPALTSIPAFLQRLAR